MHAGLSQQQPWQHSWSEQRKESLFQCDLQSRPILPYHALCLVADAVPEADHVPEVLELHLLVPDAIVVVVVGPDSTCEGDYEEEEKEEATTT